MLNKLPDNFILLPDNGSRRESSELQESHGGRLGCKVGGDDIYPTRREEISEKTGEERKVKVR